MAAEPGQRREGQARQRGREPRRHQPHGVQRRFGRQQVVGRTHEAVVDGRVPPGRRVDRDRAVGVGQRPGAVGRHAPLGVAGHQDTHVAVGRGQLHEVHLADEPVLLHRQAEGLAHQLAPGDRHGTRCVGGLVGQAHQRRGERPEGPQQPHQYGHGPEGGTGARTRSVTHAPQRMLRPGQPRPLNAPGGIDARRPAVGHGRDRQPQRSRVPRAVRAVGARPGLPVRPRRDDRHRQRLRRTARSRCCAQQFPTVQVIVNATQRRLRPRGQPGRPSRHGHLPRAAQQRCGRRTRTGCASWSCRWSTTTGSA